MARILVLHTTREGHTERIATRIALQLRLHGHAVELYRVEQLPSGFDPAAYTAVMVGASIHYGRHPRMLEHFLRRNRQVLESRPGAFFSVSLSAGGPGARPATAQRYLEKLLRRSGWLPAQTACFAGALPYSRYNPFKRLLVRLIVGLAGGDTDATRNYEYTDWVAVDRFAAAFAARI